MVPRCKTCKSGLAVQLDISFSLFIPMSKKEMPNIPDPIPMSDLYGAQFMDIYCPSCGQTYRLEDLQDEEVTTVV